MAVGPRLTCLSIVLSLLACADESDAESDGSVAQELPSPQMPCKSDEAALKACELAEPCNESSAQMVENRIAHVLLFDCVVRGSPRARPAATASDRQHLVERLGGARHTWSSPRMARRCTRVCRTAGAATIDGRMRRGSAACSSRQATSSVRDRARELLRGAVRDATFGRDLDMCVRQRRYDDPERARVVRELRRALSARLPVAKTQRLLSEASATTVAGDGTGSTS